MSGRPLSIRALAVVLALTGASVLAACSSSPSPSASGPSASGNATTTSHGTGGPTGPRAAGGGALIGIERIPAVERSPAGTFGTAPTVTVPPGAPPTALESADLIVGKGSDVRPGDTVTVQYVLATYSSGKVVQSSWTSQPFTFTLGAGEVIPGWDKGVVGMKVGGRRELIIPPSLGYKDSSPGPGVAANDTLVFVVDLLAVH